MLRNLSLRESSRRAGTPSIRMHRELVSEGSAARQPRRALVFCREQMKLGAHRLARVPSDASTVDGGKSGIAGNQAHAAANQLCCARVEDLSTIPRILSPPVHTRRALFYSIRTEVLAQVRGTSRMKIRGSRPKSMTFLRLPYSNLRRAFLSQNVIRRLVLGCFWKSHTLPISNLSPPHGQPWRVFLGTLARDRTRPSKIISFFGAP